MTLDDMKDAKFRGPVRFLDGRAGMAQQDFECVAEPRFGYSWRRENYKDSGRQFYTVDGREVADLEEACRLLALPADIDSPVEREKRSIAAFNASPKLNYGATRALSEVRCNVSVGPFGGLRAWMHRAGHSWHVGINAFADDERKAGLAFDSHRWRYTARSAAHEAYRLMYLFKADRKADTGLICDFGARCRECPILRTIEAKMTQDRDNPKWPREIEDSDIDAAKVWTCIAHILSDGRNPIDGVFIASKRDRDDSAAEAARWAALSGEQS